MARAAAMLVAALLCLSAAAAARELLAPVPAPGPSSATYTVPNWYDGARIANATLPVGGTLVIPWKGRHGVYETASYACPSSYPSPNPNGLGLVGPVANGGTFAAKLDKAGTYYFVCQVGDHCSEGQLIAVKVA